ncbi:MAG: hypothetical protein ABIJ39_08280 [Chloroflexota bacterium]
MRKSILRIIGILLVIVSLGCGPGVDAVPSAIVPPTQPVPSATVTATVRPTLTPSPTSIPFPVEVIDLGSREIEISQEFLTLSPNTYLLYEEFISGYPGNENSYVFRYMSQDGTRVGLILDSSTSGLPSTWWSVIRYFDSQPLIFMAGRGFSDGSIIFRVSLQSGEVQTWQIIPQGDIECPTAVPIISPDGRWMAADCLWQGKHYIYLVDFAASAGMELSPRGYECRGYGWEFTWSPDNQLLSWCRVGYDRATECLVSPQNGGYQCQTGDFDRVLSMSPAGNIAAFYSHSDNLDERYIYFDDAACLQNRQTCAETFRICDGPDSCDYAWDGSGENLVIVRTRSSNLRDFHTYVSLFNIADRSTEELFSGQPGDWLLEGFSPDNRWVVFSAGEVALFSLDSHLLRRTPTEGGFLGWYIVP